MTPRTDVPDASPRVLAITGTVATGLGFVEAPRWRDGLLYFSDMARGEVCRVDSAGRASVVCRVPGNPSGLGFLPGGDMLVVSMDEKSVLRFDGAELTVHASLSHLVDARLNDMVVGPDGTAYVTNFGYEVRPRRSTGVIKVTPDGHAQMQPGELWRPNGCLLTPDGKTLIVAETRVHRLTAFSVDGNGNLADQRVFAELPDGAWADGICLDRAGGVWVADPMLQRTVRVEEHGRITHIVDTGPVGSTSCALGGEDGRRLFITMSRLDKPEVVGPQNQASIGWVDVDEPGVGSP